ncbi:hypothetical protein TWF481_011267 [Arthrobotrys musiformis]|uniref:VOC domain-containing protein n=1 Tax=Arthrobotrys musiformis TaxID=47236 RepID=A0AAV9VY19_9PEZI
MHAHARLPSYTTEAAGNADALVQVTTEGPADLVSVLRSLGAYECHPDGVKFDHFWYSIVDGCCLWEVYGTLVNNPMDYGR